MIPLMGIDFLSRNPNMTSASVTRLELFETASLSRHPVRAGELLCALGARLP
jgi:hypothetical protein